MDILKVIENKRGYAQTVVDTYGQASCLFVPNESGPFVQLDGISSALRAHDVVLIERRHLFSALGVLEEFVEEFEMKYGDISQKLKTIEDEQAALVAIYEALGLRITEDEKKSMREVLDALGGT